MCSSIEAFLDDSSDWTLKGAATGRHMALLDWFLFLEHAGVGLSFRQKRFECGTLAVTADSYLGVFLWWTTKHLPNEPPEYSLIAYAAAGHMHIAAVAAGEGQTL